MRQTGAMATAASVQVTRLGPQDIDTGLVQSAASLLRTLVTEGAALGWVDAPPVTEIEDLLGEITGDTVKGNAALVGAQSDGHLIGMAYWRRYARPTHRPHADIEKVAVDPAWQGHGIGRSMMNEVVAAAVESDVEVLTLDLRGDNTRAAALYESLGFRRYGRIERFVAVGDARYDMLCYALDLRQTS